MSEKVYKYQWTKSITPYPYKDKEQDILNYIEYMLCRCQKMFIYEGLPETIPADMLELYLQVNGFACIAEHNGELFAYFGGLGGEPNVYYLPTICTVANPAQNLSKQFVIDKDCVIIKNDSLYKGLIPLHSRYATGLVENDISIDIAQKNLRVAAWVSAPDDRTKESAQKFLSDIADGEQGIIAETPFFDGIKVQSAAQTGAHSVTDLIELQQYLKASWFNEIGLNANYNMKRESLTTTESQMNFDALLPFVDHMLQCRIDGTEKVNKMFGTNITVRLSSSWENIHTASEIAVDGTPENEGETEQPTPENETQETGENENE